MTREECTEIVERHIAYLENPGIQLWRAPATVADGLKWFIHYYAGGTEPGNSLDSDAMHKSLSKPESLIPISNLRKEVDGFTYADAVLTPAQIDRQERPPILPIDLLNMLGSIDTADIRAQLDALRGSPGGRVMVLNDCPLVTEVTIEDGPHVVTSPSS